MNSKHEIEFDNLILLVKSLPYDIDKIKDPDLKTITIGIDEAIKHDRILRAGKTLYCRKSYFRIFTKMLFREYIKWISKYCPKNVNTR